MTSASSTADHHTTRLQWLALLAIVGLALVVRLIFIGFNEPHFDELWHLELSTGRGSAHETFPADELILDAPVLTSLAGAPPWHAIFGSLDTVTHPPLYPLVLRIWRSVFGENIATARVLSAILSAMCVVLLFDAARQLHGPSTALWAALLLAVSATQVEHAQQARNYMLELFFVLGMAAALLRIERHGVGPWRVMALFLCALSAIFTHYFAAPAIAGAAVYAMLRLHGNPRKIVVGSLLVCGIIFAVLWGPMALRQSRAFREAAGADALHDPSPDPIRQTALRAAGAPMEILMPARPKESNAALLSGFIYLIPLLLLRARPALLFWMILLYFVVGFAVLLDIFHTTQHLEQIRHVILAAPAVCMLIVLLLAGNRPLLAHGVPAILALAMMSGLGVSYQYFAPRLMSMADDLSDPRHADEPVIFFADQKSRWWSRVSFLGASHYSPTFPRPVLFPTKPLDDEMMKQLHRWPGVWVVIGDGDTRRGELFHGGSVTFFQEEPSAGRVMHIHFDSPPLDADSTSKPSS